MKNIGITEINELKGPAIKNLQSVTDSIPNPIDVPLNPKNLNLESIPSLADSAKFGADNLKNKIQSFTGQGKTIVANAEGKAKELADKFKNIKKPEIPSFKGIIKPPPFKKLKEFKQEKPPKPNIVKNREKLKQKAMGGLKSATSKLENLKSKADSLVQSAKDKVGNIQSQVGNIQSQVGNIQSQVGNSVKNVSSQLPNINNPLKDI
jgi:F0F1-type ATP synthase membrane subunit b/b'